jgi:quercetin dioxygenase-like cupin family protein
MFKTTVGFLSVVALAIAVTCAVLASPGSGAVGTIMARAGFADPVDIKFKVGAAPEVIHVPDTRETVMQRIVFAPGGYSGWHSHPGPAVALVIRGELTLYSGDDPSCVGRPYAAGQAFVDSGQGHVHLARNLAAEETEVWVTYFDVPTGGSVRTDEADPGFCPF